MPNSDLVITGIQLDPVIESFSGFNNDKQGFVIAPFDTEGKHDSFFLRSDITIIDNKIDDETLTRIQNVQFESKKQDGPIFQIKKQDYLNQVSLLVQKLSKGDLQKIVLSRIINHSKGNISDGPSIFNKLVQTYPHAFISLFHIPGKCTWLGATPETLLSVSGKKIQTMSLAGTKPNNPSVEWTFKEKEEQQMVSDFVENILRSFGGLSISIDGPKETEAGNICHLMTNFDCEGNVSDSDLRELTKMLHPTPAVCGMPKTEAMQLIRQTEQHDREYYAGYIGPITKNKINLFVNLRCMKLMSDSIAFFVGGGLTALSDPEAEWQETCLKAETLSRFI